MQANERLAEARILIVDDQEANVRLLERVLGRAGYSNVAGTTDPTSVISMYLDREPDLIVLDLLMPVLDGYGVMQELARRIPPGTYLPILVLTADATPEARTRALSMGARDFLTKPFDQDEALLRIRNLLETRSLFVQLRDQNDVLEERVRRRTADLERRLEQVSTSAEHRRVLLAHMAEVQRRAEAEADAVGAGEATS